MIVPCSLFRILKLTTSLPKMILQVENFIHEYYTTWRHMIRPPDFAVWQQHQTEAWLQEKNKHWMKYRENIQRSPTSSPGFRNIITECVIFYVHRFASGHFQEVPALLFVYIFNFLQSVAAIGQIGSVLFTFRVSHFSREWCCDLDCCQFRHALQGFY